MKLLRAMGFVLAVGWVAGGLAGACESSTPAPRPSVSAEPGPSVAAPMRFGAELDRTATKVSLADLVARPEHFAGRLVETTGTVGRVCQRMGCWMELEDGKGSSVRAPMAGHAFFLPKDAANKQATVQGHVELRALTDDHKRHLESEGARVTETKLSLVATSVVLGKP